MKFKLGLSAVFFTITLLLSLAFPLRPSISGSPTSVKDVLTNSELSYFALLDVGSTTGDSIIHVITTSGTAPSISTAGLYVGDTLAIGTSSADGQLTQYTVKDIGSTSTIQLNAGIGQSNNYVSAAIIATRSAIHTISFTPQSSSGGGFWQFLIKASSRSGENPFDGIPDQQGFDLGATTPSSGANGLGTRLKITDITCPNWGAGTTAYSVGTTAAINGNYYHVITCALGAGNTEVVGIGYSVAIGANLTSGSQLINPSAKDGAHVEGRADVYTFYLRHLNSSQEIINTDTLQGKIAIVESVRVTATIDPTLTFSIDAVGASVGATTCGLAGPLALASNAANTTATAVNYGSISLGAYNDLAQRLSCVTNTSYGYIVTVYEVGQMRNIGTTSALGVGITIIDTICDNGSCSPTTTSDWTANTSRSGWGYTLQNLNVGETIFSYQQGYRAFGNGATNAQQIMRNTSTPNASEQAYVCYRLTASTTQAAGNYENHLIYTATAVF
jgi:hypothetical protein